MKFIYTPTDGMNDTLTKYDVIFKAGEEVEVTDLKKASKMQKIPYFSVCLEVETAEEALKEEEAQDLENVRGEYKCFFGKYPRSDSKLETILEAIKKAKENGSE